MNPFCDKYFTKSKIVAEVAGLDPIVEYRIFTRFDGIAAFEPMAQLVLALANDAETRVEVLKSGTPFKAKDTIAIIRGRFQKLVEHETQYLHWAALPAYCALEAQKIVQAGKGKIISDFAARHLFDPTSVALASYGASVGGIKSHSTDVGANALAWLESEAYLLSVMSQGPWDIFSNHGVGTSPHALLAIFGGNYLEMGKAYRKAFPDDDFIALIDYNNKEIEDTLRLLHYFKDDLWGIRTDTCGENHAQIDIDSNGVSLYAKERGVSVEGVKALKLALNRNGGEHVKLFISSGFDAAKVTKFMDEAADSFDGIGTGSFIPKVPTATSDIFTVDGNKETKKGREWGFQANEEFYKREIQLWS